MITSARSIGAATSRPLRRSRRHCPRLTAESAWGILRDEFVGGGTWQPWRRAHPSATWRPTGGTRCAKPCGASPCAAGASLLIGLSLAGAVALATHNPNDPSLSTAAGGPPTNWLGSFGAYVSDVAAAAVRPRRGAASSGGRNRGLADDPAATRGTDRPRTVARRRSARVLARDCARPDQRIGGFRACRPAGAARSGLPRRMASRPALDLIPNPQVAGPRAIRGAAAVRPCRLGLRLFRARPDRG